jgi:hypothetical protein
MSADEQQSACQMGLRPQNKRPFPNVFIEKWHSGGIFISEKEPDALDEIAAFTRSCPQSTVTVNQARADYVLRLDHHNAGPSGTIGKLTRPANPPPDYDIDYYRYSVLDRGGRQLGAGSGSTVGAAINGACKAISNLSSVR